MTTLYRSPNVQIDAADWHMTVEQHKGGKPRTYYRWRLAANQAWQPVHRWSFGRLPNGLCDRFATYRKSAVKAIVGAGGERVTQTNPSWYVRKRMAERRAIAERERQAQRRAAA